MLEKTCTTCGETKTVKEFRKDATRSDGYHSQCKECKSEVERVRRKIPKVKERQREHSKRHTQKYPHEKTYKHREKYRETERACQKRWEATYPTARTAHKAVFAAIRQGQLPAVKECQCTKCGKQAAEYHHHRGYEPEHYLDVIPLCKSCHRLEHVG